MMEALIPSKRWFLQQPHDISQKMALFQLQKLPVSFTTLEHGNVQKQQ
jgi:hypothetical protein